MELPEQVLRPSVIDLTALVKRTPSERHDCVLGVLSAAPPQRKTQAGEERYGHRSSVQVWGWTRYRTFGVGSYVTIGTLHTIKVPLHSLESYYSCSSTTAAAAGTSIHVNFQPPSLPPPGMDAPLAASPQYATLGAESPRERARPRADERTLLAG